MKVNLIKNGKKNQHGRRMEKIKQYLYIEVYIYI